MENGKHILIDGDKVTLTRVTKINNSNAKMVSVVQGGLNLTITGDGLNVTEVDLDAGRLAATGNVTSVRFSSETTGRDFMKKLFK